MHSMAKSCSTVDGRPMPSTLHPMSRQSIDGIGLQVKPYVMPAGLHGMATSQYSMAISCLAMHRSGCHARYGRIAGNEATRELGKHELANTAVRSSPCNHATTGPSSPIDKPTSDMPTMAGIAGTMVDRAATSKQSGDNAIDSIVLSVGSACASPPAVKQDRD